MQLIQSLPQTALVWRNASCKIDFKTSKKRFRIIVTRLAQPRLGEPSLNSPHGPEEDKVQLRGSSFK